MAVIGDRRSTTTLSPLPDEVSPPWGGGVPNRPCNHKEGYHRYIPDLSHHLSHIKYTNKPSKQGKNKKTNNKEGYVTDGTDVWQN